MCHHQALSILLQCSTKPCKVSLFSLDTQTAAAACVHTLTEGGVTLGMGAHTPKQKRARAENNHCLFSVMIPPPVKKKKKIEIDRCIENVVYNNLKVKCFSCFGEKTSSWISVHGELNGAWQCGNMNEEESVTAKSSWCLAVWDEYEQRRRRKFSVSRTAEVFAVPNLVWLCVNGEESVSHKMFGMLPLGLRSQWRFRSWKKINVCSISSEPLNLLLPNLIWWCIIKSWSVEQMFPMLSSRSRSQWRFESSANVCLCCFLNFLQPNKWN